MKLKIKEIAVFGVLGALMYAVTLAMKVLPNIHLLGVFIVSITVVYRKKALYPIYVYVFVEGFLSGFATWWIPYLYIWTVLWLAVMLLPKNMPKMVEPIVYMAVSALHGLLFGILYSPLQAFLFGLDFDGTIAWIIAGLPFDLVHGVSNFCCGLLIAPSIKVLKSLEKSHSKC